MFRAFPLRSWQRSLRRMALTRPFGSCVEALQDAASRKLGPEQRCPPLPQGISIETCTSCNQRCAFCPQSHAPRPPAAMSVAVYSRVVRRLSEANFQGSVVLSLNNEPLLDAQLEPRVRELRESGFKGRLEILTNGLLLTPERAAALFAAGLDRILVNSYSETGTELTGALGEWFPQRAGEVVPREKELFVHYRLRNEVLTNRAGNAPNKTAAVLRRAACFWPFVMLPVTTDGSALLCCNDFYAVTKLGTLVEHPLETLWMHPFLQNARRKLAEADRGGLPLCSKCDFKGYLNPCSVWYAKALGI
jgi:MoaA/NifB/PqqE/SkfB family radical SAM enzyme